jgi:hypothetical protein
MGSGMQPFWGDQGEGHMKHASPSTLDRASDLLEQIRQLPGLREKSPGIFYAQAGAFLHFHEDPAGLFADLKQGRAWVRYPVNTKAEKKRLVSEARMILGA